MVYNGKKLGISKNDICNFKTPRFCNFNQKYVTKEELTEAKKKRDQAIEEMEKRRVLNNHILTYIFFGFWKQKSIKSEKTSKQTNKQTNKKYKKEKYLSRGIDIAKDEELINDSSDESFAPDKDEIDREYTEVFRVFLVF